MLYKEEGTYVHISVRVLFKASEKNNHIFITALLPFKMQKAGKTAAATHLMKTTDASMRD